MQFVPIEAVLEMSAVFAGVFFALIALAAIYFNSPDIRFQRWALSHVLFWLAFLPPNIFISWTYAGSFLSMLMKVYGCLLVLRAFGFSRISRIPNSRLHPATLIAIGLFWIPVVYFALPNTVGAIPSSILMALTFGFAAKQILTYPKNRTKIWLSAGVSYALWSVATIPMTLLPIIPEMVIFGYLQFIGQSLVLVTMFLSFLSSIRRRLERNLKLTEMTGYLISHDLRNFLNVTQSALDLAEGIDEESNEMIKTAKLTISSASHFIREVRTMLIDIGTHSTASVDIDLNILINEVLERVKMEHNLQEGQISFDAANAYYASTSPLMAQVIWNIIDNGIKHTQNQPEIKLNLSSNGKVNLSITDNAGGMDESIKQRILGDGSDGNGLGLGLMLIREISDVCGVTLRIEDRTEGDTIIGTTYHLGFPPAGGIPPSQ